MASSVQNSLAHLRSLSGLSSTSVALRTVLRGLPSAVKYLAVCLLLLNARSLPFAWHLRVFRPVFVLRFQYNLLRVRTLFLSRAAKERVYEKWFESLAPVGANPFETVTSYKSWASIDDSDFNGHLSNSSYAKTYDSARFKMALSLFASFFRAGGWIALGATHYHFLREIPMLHNYEVRERIAGWDHKWAFVVARYVTHPKSKQSRENDASKGKGKDTLPSDASNPTFQASLRTPADGLETPATPANPIISQAPTSTSDIGAATDVVKAIAAAQLTIEEPDGATLNCVAISQLCFKHGRITVPPAIVLAASGFSAPPPDGAQAYSHANPPPHYAHAQELISWRSSQKYRELMRGGWRDMPEAERWWVSALGGVVEERRKANVEGSGGLALGDGSMGLLRRGLEGARSV